MSIFSSIPNVSFVDFEKSSGEMTCFGPRPIDSKIRLRVFVSRFQDLPLGS